MARMENLPVRRGFNTSFGYMAAKIDHWTQEVSQMDCGDTLKFEPAVVDSWADERPARGFAGQAFGDIQYMTHAVDIIKEHDPDVPLFLYLAPEDARRAARCRHVHRRRREARSRGGRGPAPDPPPPAPPPAPAPPPPPPPNANPNMLALMLFFFSFALFTRDFL